MNVQQSDITRSWIAVDFNYCFCEQKQTLLAVNERRSAFVDKIHKICWIRATEKKAKIGAAEKKTAADILSTWVDLRQQKMHMICVGHMFGYYLISPLKCIRLQEAKQEFARQKIRVQAKQQWATE